MSGLLVRRRLALAALTSLLAPSLAAVVSGCGRRSATAAAAASASPAPSRSASAASAPSVNHGALDTVTPDGSPGIAATVIAATIYQAPDVAARRLGYVRLGRVVRRDRAPVPGKGCKQEWYRVYPIGFVCTDEATIDLEDPVVRAASRGPDLSQPLPYRYGFVRATAPQYLRIPTKKEQIEAEFKLEEHLRNFAAERAEWQRVLLGANDIPLDARGVATPNATPAPGFRPATEWSEIELYGGKDGRIPWWLEGGRKIPNVSGYAAPAFAVFADRVRRKTGLSFVDAFRARSEDLEREFAVAVDLRLVPISKVKPDSGSPFHGVEVGPGFPFPFAFV
ncbi:MAG TPA: L,D-transpeptidase, partial [Polyangiaceae bacterium]|nr:L,D-transpeptidase [Polyangiaceae bacterium]